MDVSFFNDVNVLEKQRNFGLVAFTILYVRREGSISVCQQCTGSGGTSRSAPFPVTQHRHRCGRTAGKGGKKRARGRQERGETAGDWGNHRRRRGYLCLISHSTLFFDFSIRRDSNWPHPKLLFY